MLLLTLTPLWTKFMNSTSKIVYTCVDLECHMVIYHDYCPMWHTDTRDSISCMRLLATTRQLFVSNHKFTVYDATGNRHSTLRNHYVPVWAPFTLVLRNHQSRVSHERNHVVRLFVLAHAPLSMTNYTSNQPCCISTLNVRNHHSVAIVS